MIKEKARFVNRKLREVSYRVKSEIWICLWEFRKIQHKGAIIAFINFILLCCYISCDGIAENKSTNEIILSVDSLEFNHFVKQRDYCLRPYLSFHMTLFNNGSSDFKYENKNKIFDFCDYTITNPWLLIKYNFIDERDYYKFKRDSQFICIDKSGPIILKPNEKTQIKNSYGIPIRGFDYNFIKDTLYKDLFLLKDVEFSLVDSILENNTILNFKKTKYKVIYKIDDSIVGRSSNPAVSLPVTNANDKMKSTDSTSLMSALAEVCNFPVNRTGQAVKEFVNL